MVSRSASVSAERPFYSRHADAYDLLITDPVAPWTEAVHARLRPGSTVLDAGCGTGRHAAALIANGHRVDLADASAELLARAAARCPGARPLLVDLCEIKTPFSYDGVTCRGVLNDMTTTPERDSVVAALAGCLRPGGRLFLDVREKEASRRRADGTTRQVLADLGGGRQLRFTSRAAWERGLLRVEEHYTLVERDRVVEESTYAFAMRPWSRAELSATLHRHGLRHIEILPGVGRRTPDRLFVVAVR
ncbi:class I SAM-dependent methyltransferase [Actinoplanes awajinensis]|uniref:Methyltransferase domain-containing protein n=1 Tax=Actinoplanes awajinensis subsp. mycoplanecinus TaxID=135947 RepID=A0A101JQ47_9ACTN|nr:methyltransferase domain-containing protein [Actinoplanes awajinensis]KUL30962.1 hypothetical protein ADL15_23730 [Actinoplanes awajinensis subsp. mycoplanecinus]